MRALASACLVVTVAACFAAGRSDSAPMKRPVHQGHSVRYLTAVKLGRGLRALCGRGSGGCPLVGQHWVIEDVGFHEHLSPAAMVGGSFTESSGGASPCCGQRFNIWGWYAMPQVSNWRDAFTLYARFLKARWPQARTVWEFYGYCSCGFGFGSSYARTMAARAWGNRTSTFMARMGFGGGRLRYP
jgi:hypothetical protein